MNESLTGREFVAVLGYDLDYAYNGLPRMSTDELQRAKEILAAPDEADTPEWITHCAQAALTWIEKELGKRE